jgi:hypothetical protein
MHAEVYGGECRISAVRAWLGGRCSAALVRKGPLSGLTTSSYIHARHTETSTTPDIKDSSHSLYISLADRQFDVSRRVPLSEELRKA